MALTFIYGNSGNGKSEYIYRKTVDMAAGQPYGRFYVVVPEQFTMSTQKSLVGHSENGVIRNVDVVSFDRLAYRVFDELGVRHTVMEETGKSLVLRRIVAEKEAELTVLRGSLKKMGYIGELKSMISELMQYDISPDRLTAFVNGLPETSALYLKLKDILCIYREFDDYLQGDYVTAEKRLELLMEYAADSALLRDAVFVFDGYTGFTPVQLKLLRQLLYLAKDVYVTVTLDIREGLYENAGVQELFYMSHKMVQALLTAAGESRTEIGEPVCLQADENSRFAGNPVLHHLEQNLFQIRRRSYGEDCGETLQLFSLLNPEAELLFAASRISRIVREKGYRYRDFAIVASSVERYEPYAEAVFGRYGIPYFVDVKQSVLYHPLTELLRGALEMLETDFSEESVFRCLRTGLCGFSMEEMDLLENYCLEKGIHGRNRWKKHFLRPSRQHGRIRADEEALQQELARLNDLRQRFWELIQPLTAAFSRKGASVREWTQALFGFLQSLSVEEQLREAMEGFEAEGQEVLASEYRQIYKIVVDLFDKFVDLLGDEVLSLAEYTDILEAGLATAKVGSIPQGNDCLILGDIERTRLEGIRILFFLGVNDGLIPRSAGRGSILSQYDRERMAEQELELAPGAREQVFLQRFYLYWNLTKPSRALYLTCSRMDSEGKASRPSYLIGVLQKLFPKLLLTEIDPEEPLPAVTARGSVDAYLSGLLLAHRGKILPEWKALHRWFSGQPDWAPLIREYFEAGFSVFAGESLEADVARLLYGTVLTGSVTRLELFARCAFAHFLEYGLKLAERQAFAFEDLDMGSMFHEILRGFCVRLEEQYSWESVTEEQQEQLLREAMEEAVLSMPNESLTESARSAYVLERIYRIMRKSVWALTQQIRRGDFRPEGYEVEFSQVSRLTPESMMRTVGRVDRVDTYENENQVYVKVIDYKSGHTKFQLLQLYYGRQLQLVVYLNAAMEKVKQEHPGKEVLPAGIFYYHLDDPMVETEEALSEQEILTEVLKQLRLNGLVSLEPEAYTHMDRELPEKRTSDVIPISLNQDLSVSRRGAQTASTENFEKLSAYVQEQIRQAADAILAGEIDVNPYRLGDQTGCDYCEYRSVCGFDGRMPGYGYRAEEKLKDEEIWEKISEQTGQKQKKRDAGKDSGGSVV